MLRIIPFLFFLLACDNRQSLEVIDHSPSFDYPIQDIAVVNDAEAYFTGGDIWSKGFMAYSSDGGVTWDIDSVCNKMLFAMDIAFGHGAAAGIDGRYFQWNGNSWTELVTDNQDIIKGLEIVDDKVFVVGGHAYQNGFIHIVDSAGQTRNVYKGPTELNAIFAVDDQVLFAVGYGTVLRSDDSGENWITLDIEGDFYKDIFMLDQNVGYLIGQAGYIHKTMDGGATWIDQRRSGFVQGLDGLSSCVFLDEDEGWVVGRDGLILHTINGGENWDEHTLDGKTDLLDITTWDERIFVVGAQGSVLEIVR